MKKLYLISTGLGHVQRGFEVYIHQLANNLAATYPLEVFCGGEQIVDAKYTFTTIWTIKRSSFVYSFLRLKEYRKLAAEQFFFFIGLLRVIPRLNNSAIYLGEYQLYCYLYKLRVLFRLNYSLVLYTGGQAAPGLFDNNKDYVHHITDVYLDYTLQKGIPANREFLLPHFVNFDFLIDHSLVKKIKEKANGKKIVLSVGTIDATIKQMHLIPMLFSSVVTEIYIIVIGSLTSESVFVLDAFKKLLREDQFEFISVPHGQIGSYYFAADILIHCAKRESFGLVYPEAAFFDLPIVTNEFKEVRYVLGDRALFVKMDLLDDAIEKVEKFFYSISEVNTKDWAVQNFSWSSLKDKYINMFNQILR